MKEAIEKIVKALVDNTDEVVVTEKPSDRSVMIVVQVASGDMGKLIGREGRTIKALRSILYEVVAEILTDFPERFDLLDEV